MGRVTKKSRVSEEDVHGTIFAKRTAACHASLDLLKTCLRSHLMEDQDAMKIVKATALSFGFTLGDSDAHARSILSPNTVGSSHFRSPKANLLLMQQQQKQQESGGILEPVIPLSCAVTNEHNDRCEVCKQSTNITTTTINPDGTTTTSSSQSLNPQNSIIGCDYCTLVFHTNCFRPNPIANTGGGWTCPYCILDGTAAGDKVLAKLCVKEMTALAHGGEVALENNSQCCVRVGVACDYTVVMSGRKYVVRRAGRTQLDEVGKFSTLNEALRSIASVNEAKSIVPYKRRDAMIDSVRCSFCMDDPTIEICSFCGCKVCFGKFQPDKMLHCDKCNNDAHSFCMPVGSSTPTNEGMWFCSSCQLDMMKLNQYDKKDGPNGYLSSPYDTMLPYNMKSLPSHGGLLSPPGMHGSGDFMYGTPTSPGMYGASAGLIQRGRGRPPGSKKMRDAFPPAGYLTKPLPPPSVQVSPPSQMLPSGNNGPGMDKKMKYPSPPYDRYKTGPLVGAGGSVSSGPGSVSGPGDFCGDMYRQKPMYIMPETKKSGTGAGGKANGSGNGRDVEIDYSKANLENVLLLTSQVTERKLTEDDLSVFDSFRSWGSIQDLERIAGELFSQNESLRRRLAAMNEASRNNTQDSKNSSDHADYNKSQSQRNQQQSGGHFSKHGQLPYPSDSVNTGVPVPPTADDITDYGGMFDEGFGEGLDPSLELDAFPMSDGENYMSGELDFLDNNIFDTSKEESSPLLAILSGTGDTVDDDRDPLFEGAFDDIDTLGYVDDSLPPFDIMSMEHLMS